ncbi:MAG: PASTA domain-containing protein [Ferruginibacter sp.]
MFKFITRRPLWLNLLFIIGLVLLMIFIFLQLLGKITRHGEYLTVPSVLNQTTETAIKSLEAKGFEVVVQDSVFIDTLKKGIVLKQLPDPNSTVKINRVVFLTVNRITLPMVDMPTLNGKTLQYALEILGRTHLKLGDTLYRPDFMKGSVLEQQFKGNVVFPGAKIPWGSSIDLVIGSGLADTRIRVPSLTGLTLAEAKLLLEQNGIGLAAVIAEPDVVDSLSAFVYKQNPPKMTEDKLPVYIQSGQLMDLWISKEMKVLKDSTHTNE